MARRRIPEVLTESEQSALLAQPNPRYPTEERNRLLLRLMLDTGLCLSEALHLQWRDLDLTTGKLHVKQGKGAKDRILWLGEPDLLGAEDPGSHWPTPAVSVGSQTSHPTILRGRLMGMSRTHLQLS